jgi:hydrophobic/amphiphilic exporter-1 (mainly G- bacteria), HAE1 family
VSLLLVASLVLGLIAYEKIPLRLLPGGFTPPFLFVMVPTLSTTPADVDEKIVQPVEDMLRTVRNIRRIRTNATATSGRFWIEFADGTNMNTAYNQVQDRLERLRWALPLQSQRWMVWKFDPDEDPVMFLGVQTRGIDSGRREYVQQKLVLPIEELEEVGRVQTWGLEPTEAVVEIDPQLSSAAGLTVTQIIEALRADNRIVSAGVIDSSDAKLPLRVLGRIDGLEGLRRFRLRDSLVLSNVAKVSISL